jgi:hypothetical protein
MVTHESTARRFAMAAADERRTPALGPRYRGVRSARRIWVVFGALLLLLAVGGLRPASALADFSWSAPTSIDTEGGLQRLSVACPGLTVCVAVGSRGDVATFDPDAPHASATLAPTGDGDLTDIACPSGSQCTAIDQQGREDTFSPTAPSSGTAVSLSVALVPLTEQPLACPSIDECVGSAGGSVLVVFDPRDPSQSSTLSTGDDYGFVTLSCASLNQCTAMDVDGRAVTVNPVTGAVSSPIVPGPVALTSPTAVSCPSIDECAVLYIGGDVVTFNPNVPGQFFATFSLSVVGDQSEFTDLTDSMTCVSFSACIVVTMGGQAFMFDPQIPDTQTGAIVDPGNRLFGVSCPWIEQCTAVDGSGGEVTFDPTLPASNARGDLFGGNRLNGVACTSVTQCTAVDDVGQAVTFSPESTVPPTLSFIDGSTSESAGGYPQPIYGIACPEAGECLEVDGDGGVTFNPLTATYGNRVFWWSNGGDRHVACPSEIQCTFVGGAMAATTPPPLGNGTYISYSQIDSGHDLASIACPSTSQCTAVDDAGNELTFDPNMLLAAQPIEIDSERDLTAVACPELTQCTAVDSQGYAITFNPLAPSGTPVLIDGQAGLAAIACPSTSLCVTVDTAGNVLTADPGASGAWTSRQIADGVALTAVSCPSISECVVTGSSGETITGTTPASPMVGPPDHPSSQPPTQTVTPAINPTPTPTPTPDVTTQLSVARDVVVHERVRGRTASFRFVLASSYVTAECALVKVSPGGSPIGKVKYKACGAELTFKKLRKGSYGLFVRVIGANGAKTAAKRYRFKVGG